MTIGFYPICGDVLHAGHVLAIQEAKCNCDYLIVGLNVKPENKTPVQSVAERWIQLFAVRWVDSIIPYEGKKDCEFLCKSLNYQIRFVGEDYLGKDWDGKREEQERCIKAHYLKREHNLSSTELKERIIKSCKNKT
jgi:glycerol-3-phosphate cytidylyltransferase